MLRRIGFEYGGQIDPFDGGPHFIAATDEISVVRDAKELVVRAAETEGKRWAIVGVELPEARPGFRAISTRVATPEAGVVALGTDARARLGVNDGQKVWLSYG